MWRDDGKLHYMLLPDLLNVEIELELLLIAKPGKDDFVSVRRKAGRNLKSREGCEGNDHEIAALYVSTRPKQKGPNRGEQEQSHPKVHEAPSRTSFQGFPVGRR
jgi:hypothetical protein